MKGNIVITSREDRLYREALRELEAAYVTAVIDKWSRIVTTNYIVWKFSHSDDAADVAKRFMELGFEFVQREV